MSSTARVPSSSSEIVDSIKKGKDKLLQVYDMLPNYCIKEGNDNATSSMCHTNHANISFSEVPELLENLRDVMKTYIVLDAKYNDLLVAKQKTAHHVSKTIADGSKESYELDEVHEVMNIDKANFLANVSTITSVVFSCSKPLSELRMRNIQRVSGKQKRTIRH